MKTLKKLIFQHAAAVHKIPLVRRFIVGAAGIAYFAAFVYAGLPALMVGIMMSIWATTYQVIVGAWETKEDKVWMAIFAVWYVILYGSIAALLF